MYFLLNMRISHCHVSFQGHMYMHTGILYPSHQQMTLHPQVWWSNAKNRRSVIRCTLWVTTGLFGAVDHLPPIQKQPWTRCFLDSLLAFEHGIRMVGVVSRAFLSIFFGFKPYPQNFVTCHKLLECFVWKAFCRNCSTFQENLHLWLNSSFDRASACERSRGGWLERPSFNGTRLDKKTGSRKTHGFRKTWETGRF